MAWLLHAAEQDDEQAREDPVDGPRAPVGRARVEHVRDRGVVGFGSESCEHRRQPVPDLPHGGVGSRLLRAVPLEVRGAVCELGEPAAQGVGVDIAETEHLPEREDADRLEVLGHQLRLAVIGDGGRRPLREGRDEVRDVLVDRPWPELRVDGRTQIAVHWAVAGQDGRRAEGPIHRRRRGVGAEELRPRPGERDVVPARHHPDVDGRDEGHRRLRPQPSVDRVGIPLEVLDRDVVDEAGHAGSIDARRARGAVPSGDPLAARGSG